MARIATNIDSLIALDNLDRTNRALGISLERLATGLRINSGKDDPGGLVSGELLRKEISQIESALRNNARSNSLIGTADAALGEIGSLLDQIKGTITTIANDATLSFAEKQALQDTVDSALDSIDRISNTTVFAGKKLIDGSLDFHPVNLITSAPGVRFTSTVTDTTLVGLPNGTAFSVTDSFGSTVNILVQDPGPPPPPPDRSIVRGVDFTIANLPADRNAAAAAIANAINTAAAAGDLVGVFASSAGPNVIVDVFAGGTATPAAGGIAAGGMIPIAIPNVGLTEDVVFHMLPSNVSPVNLQHFHVTLSVTFEQAILNLSGNLAPGAGFANQDLAIQVGGIEGATVIELSTDGAGTIAASSFDSAVNRVSDLTGVTSVGGIVRSIEFGSREFVTLTHVSGVNILGPAPATAPQQVSDSGVDPEGTINGMAFAGVGRHAILKTANLDVDFTFATGATPFTFFALFGGGVEFDATGGGALFQLGPQVDQASQANLGIPSTHSGILGNSEIGRLASLKSGGTNDLLAPANLESATRIVDFATNQVALLRSRLGAFSANTIDSMVNSLQVAQENLSMARSILVDTDFAQETAALTRLQILIEAGTSALAIANARPLNVLSLLAS